MSYRPIEIAENFRGVNRLIDPQAMSARFLYTAQNFYPNTRGILESRLGTARWNAAAYTNATRGRAIIRFYPPGGTKRKIAALNVATNDVLVYGNDSNNTLNVLTGATALTTNKNWFFEVYQAGLYMGNATEAIQKTTNGTTRADVATLPVGYPGPVYRNRLTVWGNSTYPKRVYYTDTLGELCDTDTQYRAVEHPEDVSGVAVFGRDEDRGVFGDLAVFTPTSTWIQKGDFGMLLDGSDPWDRATDRLGSLSPHSFADTPYGLIGLGYDGSDEFVVFMIPIGGNRPIVISDPIRTAEAPPVAYRHLASAVFYRGFYRLSFVPSGATTPTREWWADLRGFSTDRFNYGIEWWGPMTGRALGGYAVQADAGDANELIAVDGAAGYINTVDPANTYTDYSAAVTCILETKSMDGKDPLHYKSINGYIIGASCYASDDLDVVVTTDEGPASTSQAVKFAPVTTVSSQGSDTSGFRINLTDGAAFFDLGIADILTNYVGYYLVVRDSAGKTIEGWIKAAGTAEVLGSEAFTDPTFDVNAAWTKGTGWSVTGGKAVATNVDRTQIYETIALTGGQLYKLVLVCDSTDGDAHKGYYHGLLGDSQYITGTLNGYYTPTATGNKNIGIRGGVKFNYLTATFTSISLKPATAPGTTGVTIVNSYGGTTQNWLVKTSGFTPWYAGYEYTYEIYPPYSENAEYITPLFAHRASVRCTYDDGHLLKIKRVALIASRSTRLSY